MAKAVFRPHEITSKGDKVVLKLSHEFEEELPEEIVEDFTDYTGPTADDLRREAEVFKANWEAEKQKMLDEALLEAEKIRADADAAAFDIIRSKTDEAHIIKQAATTEAENVVKEAERRANEIVTEAEIKRDQTLRDAHGEGYEKGSEEGFRNGKAESERLVQRLHNIIEKTMERRQEILLETEQQIVDLVLLMARKVIKVLSENQRSVVMQNVLQALRKVKGRGDVVIHVNSADMALTAEHTRDFINSVESIKNISVVEDTTVDRGGCIVETDFGSIDARISSQLAELEQKILEISPIRSSLKTASLQKDT